MNNVSVLIAGVGGQGTVLAARLLGAAAMDSGLEVRGSETIGMAQRGGSVISHVRMGTGIASPLISAGGADMVIAFEPGEAARAVAFLKSGGAMIVSDRALIPAVAGAYDPDVTIAWLRDNVHGARILSGDDIVANCSARTLNVALLGAALSVGALPFSEGAMESAIRALVPEKYTDMNIRALRYGLGAGAT
jgi:indolepyruvate ferredoxin oxidoreductase beta subunit